MSSLEQILSKGKILAVCISKEKGTPKVDVKEALAIEDFGLENDAHGGKGNRQISLLSAEKIRDFEKEVGKIPFGSFGENLVVEGIDLAKLPLGTIFFIGQVKLQLTQIGKECHEGCSIAKTTGRCIMPKEGIFCKVLHGGQIKAGNEVTFLI